MKARALLVMASLTVTAEADPRAVALSGRITGASGHHPVYVALWRSDGFLDRPARQLRLEPGASLVFKFEVIPGSWALSAFEDRNGNGVLDMGLFGPQEPNGFCRRFTAWRKPRFDDVAFPIERDTPDANIALR